MKKCTLIIFLMLAMVKTQAQDYLISFEGSGDTNMVSVIHVENLTSGDSISLNGEDILHLIAPVGIGSADVYDGSLQIYPNPMAEQSTLTFFVPESGISVISIVDLCAKTICQTNSMLSPGVNSFRVSGVERGIYFVVVTGTNYTYSTKLISQSNLQSEPKIEYVYSVINIQSKRPRSTSATIDMPYTEGDQLLFTGISGIYSTIVADAPVSSKTITFNFTACTDNDGNNYATVQIGAGKSSNQTWMAENLRVTHYSNGESIPYITDPAIWMGLSTGAYSWYNNDETSYKIPYGALYNWYAVDDSRNLCPTGWHVPNDIEWTILTDFLGSESVAGGKMKSTGNLGDFNGLWTYPNLGATNESGFTGLPAGLRFSYGQFSGLNDITHHWTSTEYNTDYAWYRYLYYTGYDVVRFHNLKTFGFSVRCVKN